MNGPGHITKMATGSPMILKTWHAVFGTQTSACVELTFNPIVTSASVYSRQSEEPKKISVGIF